MVVKVIEWSQAPFEISNSKQFNMHVSVQNFAYLKNTSTGTPLTSLGIGARNTEMHGTYSNVRKELTRVQKIS